MKGRSVFKLDVEVMGMLFTYDLANGKSPKTSESFTMNVGKGGTYKLGFSIP
jgi:hypothetical protein